MRKTIFTNYQILFLLALLLHILVMPIKFFKLTKERDEISPIKVKILRDPESLRQMVESEDAQTNNRPKGKVFSSDKTRSFDRQTKARQVGKFSKTEGQSGGGGRDLSLAALGGDMGHKNPLEKAAKEYNQARNENRAESNGRSISTTSDYLPDIPGGDLTHLNTIENKFYGYYHRIKQKLEGFWGRSVQEKAEILASEGRAIVSDEHVTALRIVLSPEGEIIDVVILGSSGVKELDDAAIESFNEAGPFPNPPKDLIVDGRVTIEWGFVVNS